jgi:hypothetical protein
MNIENFKDLNIKCVCNEFSKKIVNKTCFGYKCSNNLCKYNSSRVNVVNISYDLSIEINLFQRNVFYYGFVSLIDEVYDEMDIVLELEEIIKIVNLCDVNKYIEKYNDLILFK